jgi:hypothetical protein
MPLIITTGMFGGLADEISAYAPPEPVAQPVDDTRSTENWHKRCERLEVADARQAGDCPRHEGLGTIKRTGRSKSVPRRCPQRKMPAGGVSDEDGAREIKMISRGVGSEPVNR